MHQWTPMMRAQRQMVRLALCNSQLRFDLHGLSAADRLPPPTEAQRNREIMSIRAGVNLHCTNAVGRGPLEGGR